MGDVVIQNEMSPPITGELQSFCRNDDDCIGDLRCCGNICCVIEHRVPTVVMQSAMSVSSGSRGQPCRSEYDCIGDLNC